MWPNVELSSKKNFRRRIYWNLTLLGFHGRYAQKPNKIILIQRNVVTMRRIVRIK